MGKIREVPVPAKRSLTPRHLADDLVIVEGELGGPKEGLQDIQHRRVEEQVTKDRIEEREFHDVGDRGTCDAVSVAVDAVALEGYPAAQVRRERLLNNGTLDPLQGVTHCQEQTGIDNVLDDQVPAHVVAPAPAFGVRFPVHPHTPTSCSLSVAYCALQHKSTADRHSGRETRAGLPQFRQHVDQSFTQSPATLRFLLMGLALLIGNVWIPLHWLHLRVPRRGRPCVARHLFRLDGMACFLTRPAARRYGGMTTVAPPLRVY